MPAGGDPSVAYSSSELQYKVRAWVRTLRTADLSEFPGAAVEVARAVNALSSMLLLCSFDTFILGSGVRVPI